MKIQKSAWKERPVNLNDLREAFYDIVYSPTDLNKPNFLDPDWIDTFENLYDIKLTKKELPLVQKYFEEWLAEPEQSESSSEYSWREEIMKALTPMVKLKFGNNRFKDIQDLLLDCYTELIQN